MLHVPTPSDDWPRLAQYLRERQRTLRLTQTDVPAHGGPSAMVWRDLTAGNRDNYRDGTLDKVDDVMQWKTGSASAVLHGDEPATLTYAATPEPELDQPRSRSVPSHLGELTPSPYGDTSETPIDVAGLRPWQIGGLRQVADAMRVAEDGPEILSYENANTEIQTKHNPAGRAGQLVFGEVMGSEVSEPPARLRRVARKGSEETQDPPVGGD